MDMAFSEGNRLGVPVIPGTDARLKCDKLYDLINYPDPSYSEENGGVYDEISRYANGNVGAVFRIISKTTDGCI